MEGVCDTPLHLFDHLKDNMMVDDGHPRCRGGRMRYAPTPIRLFMGNMMVERWASSPHGGRMRYAPTLVRQFYRL